MGISPVTSVHQPSEHVGPWKPSEQVQFMPPLWQMPPNRQGLSAHLSRAKKK